MHNPPSHIVLFHVLTYLPLDIVLDIISLAASDFSTALALTFTSKQISIWATPYLYKHVVLNDRARLCQFKVALDAHPVRGRDVKTLSLTNWAHDDIHTSAILSILEKTSSLSHLTWNEMSLFGEGFSVEAFPASLRYLDVCFYGFHPPSWDNSRPIPSSSHIEILQITALINFEVSMIEHISLSQFTSLKYLRLHSDFRDGGSVEFNNWLVTEIIPQFSDTLRVCVLFDRVYTGVGNRTITHEMRALIMGAVDDRIIISTDQKIRLSPWGILEEYLVRWEHRDGSHRIVSPIPIFSDTFEEKVGGVPSWEDLDRLVDRRRAVRQKWLRMYPTGVANEEVCRIVDYPFRRTAFEQAREVVLFVPGVVIWGGQALWRRLKPLSPRRFVRALTVNP